MDCAAAQTYASVDINEMCRGGTYLPNMLMMMSMVNMKTQSRRDLVVVVVVVFNSRLA